MVQVSVFQDVQEAVDLLTSLIGQGYDGTILTIDSAQALDLIGAGDEHDPIIFEGSYGPMGLKAEALSPKSVL